MRLLKTQFDLSVELVPLESKALGLNLSQRDLLQIAIQLGLEALAAKHGVKTKQKR